MTEVARIVVPRALRAAVPEGSSPQVHAGLAGDDAQRLHAWTSTAHAAELPGHLTASRPSPDASNRHLHEAARLAACIAHCAARRDGRGRWRAARSLEQALTVIHGNRTIAKAQAEAAERIGAWLATAAHSAKG